MKFNYNGEIVEAFRYGVDIYPDWWDKLCQETTFTKDNNLICALYDYIVYDGNDVYVVSPREFHRDAFPIYAKDDNLSEMSYYWTDKAKRITRAHKHVKKMENFYREIEISRNYAKIYRAMHKYKQFCQAMQYKQANSDSL